MTRVLVSIAVMFFVVSVAACADDPAAGAWARFDAARLGVSFEHPVSMRDFGFAGCGTGLLNERGKTPERMPPQIIFQRASGTDGNLGNATRSGRQIQLTVWLGEAGDSWWMPAFESAFAGMWSGRFGQGLEQQPRADESIGVVEGGGSMYRRVADDRYSIVYRVAEAAGRVVYIRGQIRDDVRLKSMTDADITAFDRVARSVAFAERKEPATEPCGEWTRWFGAGWSVCMPSDWDETAGPSMGDPSRGMGPIPPRNLVFAEPVQRFGLMLPEPIFQKDRGGGNRDSPLRRFVVAGVNARGPFPAEVDGEPIVAGTWTHVRRWLLEYQPPENGSYTARLLRNDAGQIGFVRIIEHPSQMRADARVGPLGTPEKSVHFSFSLFADNRVEYRVTMTAWYDHEAAQAVFDRIARSFVLGGGAIPPPEDLLSIP